MIPDKKNAETAQSSKPSVAILTVASILPGHGLRRGQFVRHQSISGHAASPPVPGSLRTPCVETGSSCLSRGKPCRMRDKGSPCAKAFAEAGLTVSCAPGFGSHGKGAGGGPAPDSPPPALPTSFHLPVRHMLTIRTVPWDLGPSVPPAPCSASLLCTHTRLGPQAVGLRAGLCAGKGLGEHCSPEPEPRPPLPTPAGSARSPRPGVPWPPGHPPGTLLEGLLESPADPSSAAPAGMLGGVRAGRGHTQGEQAAARLPRRAPFPPRLH